MFLCFLFHHCPFCRRHRCPHNAGPDESPLKHGDAAFESVTHARESYHAWDLQQVERPRLQRLHTQLTLPDGVVPSETAYRQDYDEKKAERQTRSVQFLLSC